MAEERTPRAMMGWVSGVSIYCRQLGDVCVSHISRNYDAMESSLWDYRNNTKDTATLCDAGALSAFMS